MSETATSETTERKPRTKKRGGLFVTDAELIERIGVPEKIGYEALRMLDSNPVSGFPRKDDFWGGRRYWPAVRAFLDTTHAANVSALTKRRSAA